ncbi:hypothetical protein N7G274_010589 [Stereocaulon virgatum]|uniref:F-box domain-containing protein n=1 Tax=Stereocaulon virgatum TaxID=373712 RepID=A0ABR3ZTC9_9LECA
MNVYTIRFIGRHRQGDGTRRPRLNMVNEIVKAFPGIPLSTFKFDHVPAPTHGRPTALVHEDVEIWPEADFNPPKTVSELALTLSERFNWWDPRSRYPATIFDPEPNYLGQRFISVAKLPPEILLMIFKQVLDRKLLPVLRLVSRQFDTLALPEMYNQITLTWHLTEQFGNPVASWTAGQRKMGQHIRHVTIDRNLPWPCVKMMLRSLERLESLRLTYWSIFDLERFLSPTGSVLDRVVEKFPKLRVAIEGLSYVPSAGRGIAYLCRPQVSSLKIVRWTRPNDEHIRELLLATTQLEKLHLSRGNSLWITSRSADRGFRMPAIRELVLHSYVWAQGPQDSINFWNWSNVTKLELLDMCTFRFLSGVPATQLAQLQVLVMDHRCQGVHQGMHVQITKMICNLLDQISSLVKLSLRCDVQKILPAVLKHSPTLSWLQLMGCPDHTSRRMNILRYEDLTLLRIQCRGLMDLTLDIEFDQKLHPPRPPPFIQSALAQFRNLRRLTVYLSFSDRRRPMKYVQMPVRGLYENDPTDTAVQYWLESLRTLKKGAEFENMVVYIPITLVDAKGNPINNTLITLRYTYPDFHSEIIPNERIVPPW